MFNDGPGQEMASRSIERCEPDYEGMAARLKKQIDADQVGLDGLVSLMGEGSGKHLPRDHSLLLYAVIGSLSMSIPNNTKEYDRLLKEMSKNKK